VLYNGMIAPLLPAAVAGAIWYQGESNASRHAEYRTLLPTMIQDWRARFGGGEFPFLIVQLAPFKKISAEPQESDWAALRESQSLATTKLPKVAIAVITDIGEQFDIHPPKKQPVGERLALAARALEYGEKIVYSGPVFKSMEIKDGKAVLTFDHVGQGLEAKGGTLTGFTICGPDKTFVNAEAVINGDKVIVSSDKVKEPKAVRYGWADFPVVNLWNKDGLPADPFRTDRPE
jgi:sialate O-acetylesterase